VIRATKVLGAGTWTAEAADTVVLEFDDRHRRRTTMDGVRGLSFLLDLPEAVMLRGGDGLALEDGRIVEVVAAPEALVEIRGASPRDLVRLAWHIGNRHLPAQIAPNAIRIRHDHVIEEMLHRLGAKLVPIEAPFDPEGGAYASAVSHADEPHAHGDPDHHGHRQDHHRHDPGHHHDHADHGHRHDHGHDAHHHEHDAHKHEH
jgi:urease accessory protein